jgi:hypothetical protein
MGMLLLYAGICGEETEEFYAKFCNSGQNLMKNRGSLAFFGRIAIWVRRYVI